MNTDTKAESASGQPLTTLRSEAIALIRNRGYERRERPFKLASGQLSHDYIDGKYAVDTGSRLQLMSQVIVELAAAKGMSFTTVGGPTMGADALAHGVAIVSGSAWFCVRKKPKSRGREQWIEGARLRGEDRVLLVDDVVTTGGSIVEAYKRVVAVGAYVVGVIPMVDRGDMGALRFAKFGVPYAPLATYHDLGIEPVSGSGLVASAS
jgi:orotate phosphoribosyltransferase